MTDEQIELIEQIKEIVYQIEALTYKQYKLAKQLEETTKK